VTKEGTGRERRREFMQGFAGLHKESGLYIKSRRKPLKSFK
jgi:hypothetical protein